MVYTHLYTSNFVLRHMHAHSFLTTAAYRLYLAGLFLIPTAFVLSAVIPLQPTKMLIAAVSLVGAFMLAVLGAFKRGGLMVPLNWTLVAVWLLPVVYLVSAAFTSSLQWSLVGGSLDLDTVFFMAMLALAASLPLYLFDSKSDYVRAFFTLLVATWLIGLFHLVRLFFGADALSFGLFTNPLFSPLGKWNDVAIYFGLVSLLSLITLEMLPLKTATRYVLLGTLVASLFLVAVVNFMPVWVVLAVISLGIVLYRYLLVRGEAKFSVAATIVFVVAVVAIIFSPSWGANLSSAFGVEQIEARPSWESTLAVMTGTLGESPVVGAGPNAFLLEWDKHRPALINQSIFWNADFTSGVGFVPTSVVTVGILGALVWVFLMLSVLVSGVRGLLIRAPEDQTRFHLMLATFVGAVYILVMAVVYLPSQQVLLVGAVILGMFIALSHAERGGRTLNLEFKEKPRIGFIAVLGLALALVVSVVSLYGVGVVYASTLAAERANNAAQVVGDFDAALLHIDSAIALYPEDRYYRLKALIHIARLNTLLNDASAAEAEGAQERFQQELGSAVESGLAAVRLNPDNYRNWQTLAGAYQTVVPLNIEGAFDATVNALDSAAALNPKMPTIPFSRAQIELVAGDGTVARDYIEETIRLKEDYIPALLLLAQIELEDGDLDEAIKRAEAASVFEPSNPVTRFQVGVLKFENGDYAGATEAFAAALSIAPEYANAHYYLGRAFLVGGDRESALKSFREVLRLNPDNAEVHGIITAIEEGRDPFNPEESEESEE